jgi:nucleoside-diphosphate-sugar epimerase
MILVTGATGLVGGHLLFALLQQYDRVAALRRESANTGILQEIFSFYTDQPDRLMERIDWRTGDLLDRESLVGALTGIECVINCAAIISFDSRERKRMIDNNVQGTRNLVEALTAAGEGSKIRLVHISSTSALGDGPGNDPGFRIDEETPRDPGRRHSGYSVSKHESERVVFESGCRAVILNPGIILGPGQWDRGSSQLFVRAWRGLRYYPYGGTGYVDVRDLSAIIVKMANSPVLPIFSSSPPSRFCVVGYNLRYRDFFNRVTDEYGKPNPAVYAGKFMTSIAWRAEALRSRLAGRPPVLTRETAESSQRISFYSSEKLRTTLGFEFRTPEETIAWVAGCSRNRKYFY